MPVSRKEFLDIQANIECRFTLTHLYDMIITVNFKTLYVDFPSCKISKNYVLRLFLKLKQPPLGPVWALFSQNHSKILFFHNFLLLLFMLDDTLTLSKKSEIFYKEFWRKTLEKGEEIQKNRQTVRGYFI